MYVIVASPKNFKVWTVTSQMFRDERRLMAGYI